MMRLCCPPCPKLTQNDRTTHTITSQCACSVWWCVNQLDVLLCNPKHAERRRFTLCVCMHRLMFGHVDEPAGHDTNHVRLRCVGKRGLVFGWRCDTNQVSFDCWACIALALYK